MLAFRELDSVEDGMTRTWLLGIEGTAVTPHLAQSIAHRRSPAPNAALPTRFSLLPAAPNPTRGTVRLSFDLPVRTKTRLEVFDPQGRRMRRFDAEFAAGRQAFEWDLRHGDGARVAPGLYNYRLTAGPFTAVGRVVVLP